MTVVADLAAADSGYLPRAEIIFSTTFSNASAFNPTGAIIKRSGHGYVNSIYGDRGQKRLQASGPSQWLNSFYGQRNLTFEYILLTVADDNAWWALAWIAAYDLTQNLEYLDTAEGIFRNLSAAWPTTCDNGGIYWSTTSTYVNAITNELFLSVAAHLANRVLSRKAHYVEWAQREWTWFQTVQMINSNGLIIDGLGSDCLGDPGATVWSYNQGVVLGGLVELSKADPYNAPSYLASANAIADAAISYLSDDNGIIHDVCEANGFCGSDGGSMSSYFAILNK